MNFLAPVLYSFEFFVINFNFRIDFQASSVFVNNIKNFVLIVQSSSFSSAFVDSVF